MAFALSSKSALRTAARTTGAKVRRPRPTRARPDNLYISTYSSLSTARAARTRQDLANSNLILTDRAYLLLTCHLPSPQSSRVVPRAAVEWYGPDRPKYLGEQGPA
jgi:hypothetical protein